MAEPKRDIATFFLSCLGIVLVIIGVLGLILPIIPGIVLIVLGLWFIKKYYHIKFINKLFLDLERLRDKTKTYITKRKAAKALKAQRLKKYKADY